MGKRKEPATKFIHPGESSFVSLGVPLLELIEKTRNWHRTSKSRNKARQFEVERVDEDSVYGDYVTLDGRREAHNIGLYAFLRDHRACEVQTPICPTCEGCGTPLDVSPVKHTSCDFGPGCWAGRGLTDVPW